MTEEERETAINRMISILKEYHIGMRVEGCGCCDSPGVTFVYDGDVIVDLGCCDFTTDESIP